ncbi:hypothetical protein BLOT_002971 [Blomia tropicalis]|nr:hypothetical protein BLOT_002971 [Blomia tropicalis]
MYSKLNEQRVNQFQFNTKENVEEEEKDCWLNGWKMVVFNKDRIDAICPMIFPSTFTLSTALNHGSTHT